MSRKRFKVRSNPNGSGYIIWDNRNNSTYAGTGSKGLSRIAAELKARKLNKE